MRPSTIRNVQFSILLLLALLALLWVSWNTAGAMTDPEPTPTCVTIEPDAVGCLIPPVTWVAPTPTIVVTGAGPDIPTAMPTQAATPGPVTVAGHAYIDINANGMQDGNEAGVGNIVIVATNPNDITITHSAHTDSAGHFTMSPLPGHYIITAHCPGAHNGVWLCYDEDWPALQDGAYIAIPLEPYRAHMPIARTP